MAEWVHDGMVTGTDPAALGPSSGDPTVLWATIVRLYWGCRAVTRMYCWPRSVESSSPSLCDKELGYCRGFRRGK
ncbi:hypothetical protein DY000_02006236 [Brassica cretica]|uniref:Uncharacterized protein n=1 Tax=Brassica cretica TaxID=69181 RepID=A0ABQ7CAW6_BRACR|nr:hypothetical protein DY000_02006236 [Brassica cretica]